MFKKNSRGTSAEGSYETCLQLLESLQMKINAPFYCLMCHVQRPLLNLTIEVYSSIILFQVCENVSQCCSQLLQFLLGSVLYWVLKIMNNGGNSGKKNIPSTTGHQLCLPVQEMTTRARPVRSRSLPLPACLQAYWHNLGKNLETPKTQIPAYHSKICNYSHQSFKYAV